MSKMSVFQRLSHKALAVTASVLMIVAMMPMQAFAETQDTLELQPQETSATAPAQTEGETLSTAPVIVSDTLVAQDPTSTSNTTEQQTQASSPQAQAPAEQGEATGETPVAALSYGHFYLVALADGKLIAKPQKVHYEPGSTLLSSLQAAQPSIVESEGSIISLNGIAGTFTLATNSTAFDAQSKLNASPEVFNNYLVVFKQGSEAFAVTETLNILVEDMLAYQDMLTNNEQAQLAYENALDKFSEALTNDELAYDLALALERAFANAEDNEPSEATLAGALAPLAIEGTDVQFDIKAGGSPLPLGSVSVSITSPSGAVSLDETGVLKNPEEGTYTYEIEFAEESKTASGTFVVGSETQTVTVDFPSGIWMKSLLISSLAGSNKASVFYYLNQDKVPYTENVVIPEGAPTINVTATKGINTPTGAIARVYYQKANGTGLYAPTTNLFTFNNLITDSGAAVGGTGANSAVNATNQAPALYFEVRAMANGGTPTATPAVGDVYFVQKYEYSLSRSRLLGELNIEADGFNIATTPTFDTSIYEYNAYVTDGTESITLSATALTAASTVSIESDGALLGSAAGSALAEVPLTEFTTPVTIAVNHDDGGSSVYNVNVHASAVVQTGISVPGGASVEVTDSLGQVVAPIDFSGNGPKDIHYFELTSGLSYTYIVSKGANYTEGSFVANEQTNPDVDLVYKDAISKLVVKSGTAATAVTYPLTKGAEGSYSYSAVAVDSATSAYAFITPSIVNDTTVTARYRAMVYDIDVATNMPFNATQNAYYAGLTYALKAGTHQNTIEFTVTYVDATTGETRGQRATLKLEQTPTLKSMVFTGDAGDVSLEPKFGAMVDSYNLVVPKETTELNLRLCQAVNKLTAEEYTIAVDGELGTVPLDATATNPYRDYTLDISNKEDGEIIPLVLSSGSTTRTIEIVLKRSEKIDVTFVYTPADAVLEVSNAKGVIAPNEDGTYTLATNSEHSYTLVKKDYVSISETFIPTTSQRTITCVMEPVPNNDAIDPTIDAEWPVFRGEDNNAITDTPTPTADDNSHLNWAFKIGNAGMPILVNGYVVTTGTGPDALYMLDSVSGKVIAAGNMVAGNGFAIVTPLYAEGMIFVSLSGGIIQAFNATPREQTQEEKDQNVYGRPDVLVLDSVWVYTDPLGGAPNNPLSYSDGCLYMGMGGTRETAMVCISIADEDPTQTHEKKLALWRQSTNFQYYWAGAYASERHILVGGDVPSGSSAAKLLSIDPVTGEVRDTLENMILGNIRSSITYDKQTDRYYFTNQGSNGSLWSVGVDAEGKFFDVKSVNLHSASTSTPVIYNGRAYVGVAGAAQFIAYQGAGIAVIDIPSWSVAYVAATRGYPQSSGLLSTAYLDVPHLNPDTGEMDTGYVYVYFSENVSPGNISYIIDKAGLSKPALEETDFGYTIAPVLFTPQGSHSQYSLPSLVVDEFGTLYYKTDANYLLAVGAEIDEMSVVVNPNKMVYKEGETFDPTGIRVEIRYTNGRWRDVTEYVTFSEDPLSADSSSVAIVFPHMLYGKSTNPNDIEINNPDFPLLPRPSIYLQVAVLTEEQTKRVVAVEEAIDAIEDVRLDNEALDRIENARGMFDELSEVEQVGVANSADLRAAEAEYRLQQNINAGAVSVSDALDGRGTIYSTLNKGGVSLTVDHASLSSMVALTLEEYYAILDGKSLTLSIDVKRLESLSAQDKALLDKTLKDNSLLATDTMLELSVYKQLEDGTKQSISSLLGSGQLTFALEIASADQQTGRHFYIVHLHEDAAQILTNSTPDDAALMTFATGSFSPFVLAYSKTSPSNPDGNNPGSPGSNPGSSTGGNSLPAGGGSAGLSGGVTSTGRLSTAVISSDENPQTLTVGSENSARAQATSSAQNSSNSASATYTDPQTPLAAGETTEPAGQNLQITLIVLGILAAGIVGFLLGRLRNRKKNTEEAPQA